MALVAPSFGGYNPETIFRVSDIVSILAHIRDLHLKVNIVLTVAESSIMLATCSDTLGKPLFYIIFGTRFRATDLRATSLRMRKRDFDPVGS